ncbi:MAG: hypothetical protein ISR78_00695 [Spirochaetia bacterium]|nr:hypothetical protein [Spirochaetia bacterium]
MLKENVSRENANKFDLTYHQLLGKVSHNPIVENIYNFIIELFAPTINPIHSGVYEAHENLQKAIMNRDVNEAVSCVRVHTEIWIASHNEDINDIDQHR